VTADADVATAAIDHFIRTFGSPNPNFTVRYAGFVGTDTSADLGGTLTFTTLATPGSLTGAYAVTPGGLTSSNYTITFVPGILDVTKREGAVAYIGQTLFLSSGSSSTTAQVTLSASVWDDDGSGGSLSYATVTFTDVLSGKVLASSVKVSPVVGGTEHTGTANTVVTLSTGQYGAQEYLIEVSLGGAYKNCQQTGPVANASGTYCTGSPTVSPSDPAFAAAHPTVVVMIPPTQYSTQGAGTLDKLTTAAGTYGDALSASYAIGLKYNNKGTNPQGQIQLVLQLADGTYYVKSNSITSIAFSGAVGTAPAKDVTIYTKASIYKVSPTGTLTSIDGGVTLRVDAHEGCTTSPSCGSSNGDTIGFTVLSGKNSSLYYSNNWVYDTATKSWRTVPYAIATSGGAAVVIN
jgi:hypothetical protein